MLNGENGWICVNRFLAFAAGGLTELAVMSLAVVAPVRSVKEALAKQLDEVQNGAARLLAEAKVLAESKSCDSALRTLDSLFETQRESSQVVEGRRLYADIEMSVEA